MLRKLILAASLAASFGLFAQSQPASTSRGQAAGMSQSSAPTVVVAPPSVYVVGGGLYGTGVYLAPYGTMPFQGAGVSLAGRAGISLESPLQPGFITALPSVIPGALIYGPLAGTPEAALAETTRPIYDLGPSYYGGEAAEEKGAPSLGEVAAEYKKGHPRAVKVYTNVDADRLSKP